ncbi:hypothetical protein N7510_004668 [Penicillium lagena]|uniref:uncharacterized protein n=1 Tax=Penicillium lagena TaxID=94218 RepID=UPI002541F96B|nr:uncharacterized protein N7510_004668 [Penicillium lagena]KAJ5620684.1 hypothetical protein N7510_004668 [Penicillium lagena]
MKRVTLAGRSASSPQGLVCHFCQLSVSRRAASLAHLSPVVPKSRRVSSSPRPQFSTPNLRVQFASPLSVRAFASTSSAASSPETAIREISKEASAIRNSDTVPANETVVNLLQRCQQIAEDLVSHEHDQDERSATNENNAISPLLNLDEKKSPAVAGRTNQTRPVRDPKLAESVSRIATDLLKDKKVFISPEVLAHYTTTQTLLRRPEHFPEIFHLYANKPVPEENSSPVKFHKANPKNVNSAVPADLANQALDVAIAQKNLSLVLAIIDNTFCAPAFHRAKIFKKAAVPLAALAAAPAACYTLASWASTFQNTMDPSTATGIAFAASLAYVGGTSSIGIMAITTANDQMERVTWLSGIPLRHRWLREEERAAMDKVAVAWGFKDPYMRGEEVGAEWEALREFIGMRGMILDKTELMEGMQ